MLDNYKILTAPCKLLSSDCKGDVACQNQNKFFFESTLMSGIKSVLAQNPFQEEKKPNSVIGSIKENWYNNIPSLGSKNAQRKLWHFFFLLFFFGLMTPTIFSHPDSFAGEGRKYYMGPFEDGFSFWNSFSRSLLRGVWKHVGLN